MLHTRKTYLNYIILLFMREYIHLSYSPLMFFSSLFYLSSSPIYTWYAIIHNTKRHAISVELLCHCVSASGRTCVMGADTTPDHRHNRRLVISFVSANGAYLAPCMHILKYTVCYITY